jgi:hypothetical protein
MTVLDEVKQLEVYKFKAPAFLVRKYYFYSLSLEKINKYLFQIKLDLRSQRFKEKNKFCEKKISK